MKKKIKIVFFVFVGFIFSDIFAKTEQINQPINVTMVELGNTIALLSSEVFDDTQAEGLQADALKKNVEKLLILFQAAEPHMSQNSVTYQISYDVMMQYLEDISTVTKRGDFDLTKGMLKTLPQLCAGCHTQDTQKNKLFSETKNVSFKNEFQHAEFNFITRDYDSALKYYTSHLKKSEGTNDESIDISLKRILVIYTQLKQNPKQGIKVLKQYSNNKMFSEPTRLMIREWIKGLQELSSNTIMDEQSFEKREAYLEHHLNQLKNHSVNYVVAEKDKIFYITLRGLLYEHLNNKPLENDIPVILYWLAVCDRTLEYGFYDSLSDLYLKECILSYSSHPYAHKCFKEYENYIKFSFTGSGGTYVPEDIEGEIKFLKEIIDKAQ